MSALADVKVANHLLWADHNMPCPICLKKPAVFDCQREFFSPCWDCQDDGWRTAKRRRWFRSERGHTLAGFIIGWNAALLVAYLGIHVFGWTT